MELDIPYVMMAFFVTALIVGVWKIYVFLPNKQLSDDDTTKESKDELTDIMIEVIRGSNKKLTLDELFEQIKDYESFDRKHYWRFNKNRLNQLLNGYYLKYPPAKSIADIYKDLK